MKRDVVRDFLNLPGIVGIALVDGRSRPFFFGIDQTLNFQQKEALAQGIQQVVETTPSSFESFEFQFSGYQVYIYKLEHGIILLVLTNEQLVYPSYSPLVSQLKNGLQEDLGNAIANFRLAAGNVTLSGQRYWNRQLDPVTATLTTGFAVEPDQPSQTKPPAQVRPPSSSPTASPAPQQNGRSTPHPAPSKTPPSPSPEVSRPATPKSSPSVPQNQQAARPKPAEEKAPSRSTPPPPSSTPASATNPPSANPSPTRADQIQIAREKAARQRRLSNASPSSSAPDQSSASPVSSPNATPTQNFTSPSEKPADQEALAAKSGNTGHTPVPKNEPITLKEILDALNQLSKLTTRYLGTNIVANYWKSSRPPVEWLANFEVDRSGKIEFVGPMTPGKPSVLSSVQHQLLRDWVNAFIQRCSRVIRDFSKIIQSMDLKPHQRDLLLPKDN